METQEDMVVKTNKELGRDEVGEENVELDLEQFGGTEITTGGGKPTFKKIKRVKVKSVVLMTKKDKKEDKSKDGSKTLVFYPVYLKAVFEYPTDDNKEMLECFESYGGGKLFVSDETKEVKFWLGENSALGKLRKLLEDNFDFKGTLKEIPKLLKDKQVGIQTETVTVAGVDYPKNSIKQFY